MAMEQATDLLQSLLLVRHREDHLRYHRKGVESEWAAGDRTKADEALEEVVVVFILCAGGFASPCIVLKDIVIAIANLP